MISGYLPNQSSSLKGNLFPAHTIWQCALHWLADKRNRECPPNRYALGPTDTNQNSIIAFIEEGKDTQLHVAHALPKPLDHYFVIRHIQYGEERVSWWADQRQRHFKPASTILLEADMFIIIAPQEFHSAIAGQQLRKSRWRRAAMYIEKNLL